MGPRTASSRGAWRRPGMISRARTSSHLSASATTSRPIRLPSELRRMSDETILTSEHTMATATHGRIGHAAPRAVLVVYLEDATTRVVEVPDGAQLTFG